ncbi:MAG: hypothetical protein HC915_04070, partial [Anaerolineae bacterium]|nr:hypothetical protein [Anaerolineae bacterium]
MPDETTLRRKWTFRMAGKPVVFVKGPQEKPEHVYLKAFLLGLYLPQYPGLRVEVKIADRYKPDLVAVDEDKRPLFWAEAGQVGAEKLRKLVKRYPKNFQICGAALSVALSEQG